MTNELAVPFLRSGTGTTPADGGCIMQVIDWLDNAGWTDNPECVHPVFRSLGIHLNDTLPDAERQMLLDLAPRLMGTNTGDGALTRKLLGYLARQVYGIYDEWAKRTGYDDKGSVLACIEAAEQGEAARAAEAAWAAEAARAARAAGAAEAAGAQLLVGCLDEYDRITGRGTVDPIPPESFAAVCEVMAR